MRTVPRLTLFGLAASAVAAAVAAATVPASARPGPCAAPPDAAGGPGNVHSRHVETQLQPPVVEPGAAPFTLDARMRLYGVTGISVAVIHDGRIDWARGWGLRDADRCAPVTPDTVFQAASISKVVTAVLALRMAEQGRIALDGDINAALRSWRLPHDPHLAPRGVTLAQLLSHSAGLGVHGFPGYPAGSALPTPAQILDGAPPANSPAVRSVLPAGAQWQYSGGGYVLAQLALADAGAAPFAALATRELFRPLGMTRSSFAQPPSPALGADIALGHAGGRPIPGGYHVYPELGPAGLWTTPTDLARLLIDIQASAAGKAGRRLSPGMTRRMLTPVKGNWGLGPALYLNGARRFGHDGLNEGFQSAMLAYADRGEGIVVLTSGGQGRRLIDEVVRAVATDYGWSDLAPPATVEQRIAPADLARAVGHFEGGGLSVDFEARGDGLFAHTGGPAPERLQTLSPTRFRSAAMGLTIEFDARYSGFDIVEGGPPVRLSRMAAGAKAGE